MVKIGDNVRFLNSTGGGKVTKIDEKKGLVYVEDSETDGFEVPVLIKEVVVVGNISETTNVPKKDFSSKPVENIITQPQEKLIEKKPQPIMETPEGEILKVLLAFFPIDIKQMQTTSYECYLINDSNYFLYYNLVIGSKNSKKSVSNGRLEPNTQEFMKVINKEELSDWEHLQVQTIAFKEDRSYIQQSVIDAHIRLNPVKFYKLHTFTENDYFDEPSLLVDILEEKGKQMLADISADEIKEAIYKKEEPQRRLRIEKKPQKNSIIEIDLHINSLLDNTNGMSNAEILECQMKKFHDILTENKNNKGQKIVFIHGKGEGVLRKEIEQQLKTTYKQYYFQDASFREYGFGATMVTIK